MLLILLRSSQFIIKKNKTNIYVVKSKQTPKNILANVLAFKNLSQYIRLRFRCYMFCRYVYDVICTTRIFTTVIVFILTYLL